MMQGPERYNQEIKMKIQGFSLLEFSYLKKWM